MSLSPRGADSKALHLGWCEALLGCFDSIQRIESLGSSKNQQKVLDNPALSGAQR